MWNLEYSGREWEVEAAQARKLPIPRWAQDKPTVPVELNWFWESYWKLDTCRHWSEGMPKPIPWDAYVKYAHYHKVDMDYLYAVISELDGAYLQWKAEQYEKRLEEIRREADRKGRRGKKKK